MIISRRDETHGIRFTMALSEDRKKAEKHLFFLKPNILLRKLRISLSPHTRAKLSCGSFSRALQIGWGYLKEIKPVVEIVD